jgi:hypothetical protein
MDALKLLFTSSVGLMSLVDILLTIAIGAFFSRWFSKKIEESDAERQR